jgi:hypothetical protein
MTISVIYSVTFNIQDYKTMSYFQKKLFLENTKLFLEKKNYFLIIQEKLNGKVHLNDTICKDNYNYCHL